MLDRDALKAFRPACAQPRAPRDARYGPEPRHLFPDPRGRQHLLRRRARHGRRRDARDFEDHRPRVQALRTTTVPQDAENIVDRDGFGDRDPQGDGRLPERQRREGGCRDRSPLPSLLGEIHDGGAARKREAHLRAGPHQGAGSQRRSALPGRGGGVRHLPVREQAAHHRRPLRSLVEGHHAGADAGRVRRT